MKLPVQFFSGLREVVGQPAIEVELPAGATVADLLAQLYRQIPALETWDGSLLIGAGVEFVRRDYVLQPGDDIALMPPVQGG